MISPFSLLLPTFKTFKHGNIERLGSVTLISFMPTYNFCNEYLAHLDK